MGGDDTELSKILDDMRALKIAREGKRVNRHEDDSGSFTSQVESLYMSDPSILSPKDTINNDIDLRLLRNEAAQELSSRSKNSLLYHEVSANTKNIMKRLEYLSKKAQRFTIKEAIEIADAAHLLKVLGRPGDDFTDMPGKMAYDGALLILQAEKLTKKGYDLLDRSKSLLQSAKFIPDSQALSVRRYTRQFSL